MIFLVIFCLVNALSKLTGTQPNIHTFANEKNSDKRGVMIPIHIYRDYNSAYSLSINTWIKVLVVSPASIFRLRTQVQY